MMIRSLKDLSPSQRRLILKAIVKAKSKKDLAWWIENVFKLDGERVVMPTDAICENHNAPIDFIADALFGDIGDAFVKANRTGGKTVAFAILDVLFAYLYNGCEITTSGAIKTQAQKCYKYFSKFIAHIEDFIPLVKSSLMSKTEFKNGSVVEIITATLTGVNSPHPQKAFIDEIELIDWNILQEAMSMAKSKYDIKAQTIMTSTQKFAGGVVSKILREAEARKLKVYEWCIWEVVEPLPKDKEFRKMILEMFPEMPKKIIELGDKKEGFYKWEDLIQKKLSLDPEVWETQWLCKKPGRIGSVYPQFLNQPYPKGHILARDVDFNRDIYIFEDFGFSENHPDVVLFVEVDAEKQSIYIFDELYFVGKIGDYIVSKAAEKLREYGIPITYRDGKYDFNRYIRGWIPDPHNLTEIAVRKKLGCPVLEALRKSKLYEVKNGISLVRRKLQNKEILFHPRCKKAIGEFEVYRRKPLPNGDFSEEPEKKNDHAPDAVRYGLVRLFPVAGLSSFSVEYSNTGVITGGLKSKIF